MATYRNRKLRRKRLGGNILEVVTVTEGLKITVSQLIMNKKNMNISYDPKVDEDNKGKVLAIEILDASINIPAFNLKKDFFEAA